MEVTIKYWGKLNLAKFAGGDEALDSFDKYLDLRLFFYLSFIFNLKINSDNINIKHFNNKKMKII